MITFIVRIDDCGLELIPDETEVKDWIVDKIREFEQKEISRDDITVLQISP